MPGTWAILCHVVKAVAQTAWVWIPSPPWRIRAWFLHMSNGNTNSIYLIRLLVFCIKIINAKCFAWCWHVVSTHMWVKIKWNKCHPHFLDITLRPGEENNSQLGSPEAKFQTQSIWSLTPCPSPFPFTYLWGCLACTQLFPPLS